MFTRDRVAGAAILLFSLYVMWEDRVLPLGTYHRPGPGYMPLILAIILAAAGLLTPVAGRLGVKLEEPTRSQVTVDGELTIELANPYHAHLSAYATSPGSHDHASEQRCAVSGDDRVEITCKLDRGQYEVRLFGANGGKTGTLDYFGSIQVNAR